MCCLFFLIDSLLVFRAFRLSCRIVFAAPSPEEPALVVEVGLFGAIKNQQDTTCSSEDISQSAITPQEHVYYEISSVFLLIGP
jgi:hypothetical protein